jgi:hypothetical protein
MVDAKSEPEVRIITTDWLLCTGGLGHRELHDMISYLISNKQVL